MQIIKTVGIIIVGSALLWAEPYGIKSGKITYDYTRSGTMRGSMKLSETGMSMLIFDAYGKKRIEMQETSTKISNAPEVKNQILTYIEGKTLKHVDFKKKKIRQVINNDKDFTDKPYESLLERVGAKKEGTDKVLGFTCTIWKLGTTKTCIYKGVELRTEGVSGDVKTLKIATKVEFDISIQESDFELPDYPIVEKEKK